MNLLNAVSADEKSSATMHQIVIKSARNRAHLQCKLSVVQPGPERGNVRNIAV